MASVPRDQAGDAAGLYNMARNLGGSVGLALLGTFIDRRNSFHEHMIRESVTANSLIGQEHLAGTAAGFFAQTGDMAYSKMQAIGQLAAQMSQQASVITYSETFYVLAIALSLCIPLALLLKKPAPNTPSAGH
jgi:DHA2 family multidrug resistance protein